MRLVEPQGERYWQAWREGCVVHTVSGTGDRKPRATQKEFATERAAQDDLEARYRKKLREGLVFRADSETLPVGWNRTLIVHVSRLFTGFLALDYSPQENLIAIGRPDPSENQASCDLVLLEAETGVQRQVIPLKAFDLWQAQFDPQGPGVYVRADGVVARVDRRSHERIRLFATPPFTFLDFRLSGHGTRILGSDHSRLVIKDVDSGALVLEVPLEELKDHKQCRAAALSASGNLAALCEEPGRIQLFDLTSGARRTLTGDFPYIEELLIHPSERYLILREHYADMGLRVIDMVTGEELSHFRFFDPAGLLGEKRRRCWGVSLTADGSILARGEGYNIVLHDFETGEELARLNQEFAVRYHSNAFTFAGTNDTLLSRVDLGLVSVYRLRSEAGASSSSPTGIRPDREILGV